MKGSKYLLLLTISIVLSVFLAACSNSNEKNGATKKDNKGEYAELQEITVLESGEITSMDSVLADDFVAFSMINNVNEGLYSLDQKQNPIPAIADGEPKVNDQGTVYTFKLKNVKWSNGDAITAHDFVYSWQRALSDQSYEYGYYIMAGVIKNADKVYQGNVGLEELGVKALSDQELEITLEKPVPYIKYLLAVPTFYPQNKKFVEEKGDKYASNAENLIFNGPFKMTKWDGVTATEWTLEKNDAYWDAKNVMLTKITFNVSKDPQAVATVFEAGEADVTPKLSTPAVISQYLGDDRLVTWGEPTENWLKFNQKNKALSNKNIRLALSMAFDKEAIVDDILQNGSLPANYAVPANFVKHPESGEDFREKYGDFNKYNVKKAQEYWEKGLSELGLKELKLTYVAPNTEVFKTVDTFILDQLQKNLKGLSFDYKSVPGQVGGELHDKQEYDIIHFGWGPDYPDAMTYSDLWVTNGDFNKMDYSNPKYDQLIKDAQTTLANKPAARFEALQKAEKILMDDAAIAGTFQRASNVLVNPKLEGFTYHVVGPEYSWKYAKLKK